MMFPLLRQRKARYPLFNHHNDEIKPLFIRWAIAGLAFLWRNTIIDSWPSYDHAPDYAPANCAWLKTMLGAPMREWG